MLVLARVFSSTRLTITAQSRRARRAVGQRLARQRARHHHRIGRHAAIDHLARRAVDDLGRRADEDAHRQHRAALARSRPRRPPTGADEAVVLDRSPGWPAAAPARRRCRRHPTGARSCRSARRIRPSPRCRPWCRHRHRRRDSRSSASARRSARYRRSSARRCPARRESRRSRKRFSPQPSNFSGTLSYSDAGRRCP